MPNYNLIPLQDYLQSEPPETLAKVLDETMYDIVLNAEHFENTEGISQRYHTLKQLRDIILNLQEDGD
jgi:hypothetical protein